MPPQLHRPECAARASTSGLGGCNILAMFHSLITQIYAAEPQHWSLCSSNVARYRDASNTGRARCAHYVVELSCTGRWSLERTRRNRKRCWGWSLSPARLRPKIALPRDWRTEASARAAGWGCVGGGGGCASPLRRKEGIRKEPFFTRLLSPFSSPSLVGVFLAADDPFSRVPVVASRSAPALVGLPDATSVWCSSTTD